MDQYDLAATRNMIDCLEYIQSNMYRTKYLKDLAVLIAKELKFQENIDKKLSKKLGLS